MKDGRLLSRPEHHGDCVRGVFFPEDDEHIRAFQGILTGCTVGFFMWLAIIWVIR